MRRETLKILFCLASFVLWSVVSAQSSQPDAPTHLKAKKGVDGSITLTWKASPTKTIAGYNIYMHAKDRYYRVNGKLVEGTQYILRSQLGDPLVLVVRAMESSPPHMESLNSNEIRIKLGNPKLKMSAKTSTQ